jgi:hypothetical protein
MGFYLPRNVGRFSFLFCIITCYVPGLLEGYRPWNLKYAKAFNENVNEGGEEIPLCPC